MTEGEKVFFTHYVEYINMRLRRFFIRLLVAFSILGLTLAAGYLYIDHISDENRTGLCAIRKEAENRIVQSREFLKENPKGVPGISPAVVVRGIQNAQGTVDSLKGVTCD